MAPFKKFIVDISFIGYTEMDSAPQKLMGTINVLSFRVSGDPWLFIHGSKLYECPLALHLSKHATGHRLIEMQFHYIIPGAFCNLQVAFLFTTASTKLSVVPISQLRKTEA